MQRPPWGFIITRHVKSEQTNCYWNRSLCLLAKLYPDIPVIIIDDNSDPSFIHEHPHGHLRYTVISSPWKGRGELLPYCLLLSYKWFDYAVIIHDSVFIHRPIQFSRLVQQQIPVIPLWHFMPDQENIGNIHRLCNACLQSNQLIERMTNDPTSTMSVVPKPWNGCFGGQSFISLSFLETLERKYKLTNLLTVVKTRPDRCSLERVLGAIFCIEYPALHKHKSIFGNIHQYENWGLSYAQYLSKINKGHIRWIYKIWTGR